MKLSHLTAALLLASSLATPALADVSKRTADFITKATIGNQFEIDSSKLALDRSEDDAVREFAKRMIEDHTRAMKTMKSSLPSDADPTLGAVYDAKHAAKLKKLQTLDEKAFDAAYVAEQTAAHNEAVALFSNYARKGDAKDLKDFAAATLPSLKAHQAHIKGFKHTKDGYEAVAPTPVSKHKDDHPSPRAVKRH